MDMRRWTQSEVDFASQNYGKKTSRQIAEELGRSHLSVKRKLFRLGVRMSEDDFARALKITRINGDQIGKNNPNWKGDSRRSKYEQKLLDKARHPMRHKARQKLTQAIRSGKIHRQPCEVCGETNSEGHHDDYSKPLAVRWLCRKHHVELHKSAKRGCAPCRLAIGRLYRYECPDCGEVNGGGIENEKHEAGCPNDPWSPINQPCIWCGKGPMVVKYRDEEG